MFVWWRGGEGADFQNTARSDALFIEPEKNDLVQKQSVSFTFIAFGYYLPGYRILGRDLLAFNMAIAVFLLNQWKKILMPYTRKLRRKFLTDIY